MSTEWAILLSGFVAACIAVWGILSQRAIARRRAALDYIARSESDRDLIAARKQFIELAKDDIAQWASEDKEKTEQAQSIRIVLNDFELISIGIQRGIIDYKLYRMWLKSSTRKYWDRGKPFVQAIRDRTQKDTYYHEFEELVRWLSDEKPPKRSRWRGNFF